MASRQLLDPVSRLTIASQYVIRVLQDSFLCRLRRGCSSGRLDVSRCLCWLK